MILDAKKDRFGVAAKKQVLKNKYYGSYQARVADKRGMCH